YIEGNEDLASQGHQIVPETIIGKNLTMSLDCKSCHKLAEKSIGPSYEQVADRYSKDPKASSFLIQKIIKGGAGSWGDVAMPAHPTLKEGDAKMITTWVLSLRAEKGNASLQPSGSIMPLGDKQGKAFTLTASYTDIGAAGLRPLTGSSVVFLRSNQIDLGKMKGQQGFNRKDSAGDGYLVMPATEGNIRLESIDVTGVSAIELSGFGRGSGATYQVEVRKGSANGPSLGSADLSFKAAGQKTSVLIPLRGASDAAAGDLYLVFKKEGSQTSARPFLKTARFIAQ
ncbi:MAG: c-type cytochrome, partial [Chitinophagaceae bacterium]